MEARVREKEEAIQLRRKGYSYNDILRELPVAKSSLSLWLKDLSLTGEEKKYLKTRTDSNISRGRVKAATAHRRNRQEREELLRKEARQEFRAFVKTPFFHTGVALYWAEGTKRSDMFQFANSDPAMINLMLSWIEEFFCVSRSNIAVRLYMHKPFMHENWEQYWSQEIGVPLSNFRKTIYKPTGSLVKKRPNYKGCLRIELPKSTNFRRKMIFWQTMLVEYYSKR